MIDVRTGARPAPHAGLRGASHWVNPLVLRLAGTRFLPLYGVIVHRGRRSGATFRTPVVMRPTSDGFVDAPNVTPAPPDALVLPPGSASATLSIK